MRQWLARAYLSTAEAPDRVHHAVRGSSVPEFAKSIGKPVLKDGWVKKSTKESGVVWG
jgi:hypothetical protein